MHVALSQWISVDHAIARSINIERDARDRKILEHFQITPVACDALHRLADAFDGEKVNAWSLTGPYGTGKSAFCNYLLALVSGEKSVRKMCFAKLKKVDGVLAKRLKNFASEKSAKTPVIGIRAISQYESLNRTLAGGLAPAITGGLGYRRAKKWRDFSKRVETISSQEWPETRDIVSAFKDLVAFTNKPVFIVVDEFGKNLEFQAHHSGQGDIFALQSLAETDRVFLWVCLHQAFQSYAGALSQVQRQEWLKIQGRFEDRPYVEPPVRSFSLIRDALSVQPPDIKHEAAVEQWAQGMADAMSGIKVNGLAEIDLGTIKSLYPFHPLAVYLVGEMTRRFAQNDRTLFSFLSSGEPHAFASCLNRLDSNEGKRLPTLSLDMLYDYFSETGALRNADRSENQRWIEIQSMIAAHGGMDHGKTKVLKTIGVLNLLSTLPGVEASEEMIHAALATSFYRKKVGTNRQLQELKSTGVLLYRRYANEYRLWEGSDFDLDLAVLQARGKVALRAMPEILEEIVPQPNLVAARHSVTTGTLREFKVKWSTADDLPSMMDAPQKDRKADGVIWLVLGKQKMLKGLITKNMDGEPVIIGYAPCFEQVRQLMLEAAATRDTCDAPELERDGVARREALHRAAKATEILMAFLKDTFSPGSSTVRWLAKGSVPKISSQRELSSLVSDLCDKTYDLCPHINNEMLNVDRLTGQAAAARNRVAEALANNFVQEDLGFSGYGPEVAVYRTVIKAMGLHRQNKEGMWALSAPDQKEQPQLSALWDLFGRLLKDADAAGRDIPVCDILAAVRKPPFGLRKGPAPLLLVHYLLVYADEIAVYESGTFKPLFGDCGNYPYDASP